jgi:hypothetical protein
MNQPFHQDTLFPQWQEISCGQSPHVYGEIGQEKAEDETLHEGQNVFHTLVFYFS